MSLGTEVGLGPGHIVLDGDLAPLPPRKGHSNPLFSAHVYCGHGRSSPLLLSSCEKMASNGKTAEVGQLSVEQALLDAKWR